MFTYRQIHVHIWKDAWFVSLTPSQRFLFIYLFSNERAHVSGVYEMPFPTICHETGLRPRIVRKALAIFQKAGRICYDEATGDLFVRSLMRYNGANVLTNAKVKTHVRTHRDKGGARIQYWDRWREVYPEVADRLSMPDPSAADDGREREVEKEKEPEKDLEKDKEIERQKDSGAAAVAAPQSPASRDTEPAGSKQRDTDPPDPVPPDTEQHGSASNDAEPSGPQPPSSASNSTEQAGSVGRGSVSQASPRKTKSPPPPPELGAVVHLWEQARQEPANDLDRQRLQDLAREAEEHRLGLDAMAPGAADSGFEWLRQAIKAANGARKPGVALSLNFLESVLRRWFKEGFQAPWGGEPASVFREVVPWGTDL